MYKLKRLYFGLLIIIGFLAISIAHLTISQSASSTVTLSSKQDFITAGDELVANFKIYNPNDEPRFYTFAFYLNDAQIYENHVTINPKRNFVFGGHSRALEPGIVKVTGVVYEGKKERLLDNISYFVTVKEKPNN